MTEELKIRTIEPLMFKMVAYVEISTEKDEMKFILEDDTEVLFYHQPDCCESVVIDDVVGDLESLIGSPILTAQEITKPGEGDNYGGTATWTFYKFATIKGYVDVKWYGESNGYYSETVDILITKPGVERQRIYI